MADLSDNKTNSEILKLIKKMDSEGFKESKRGKSKDELKAFREEQVKLYKEDQEQKRKDAAEDRKQRRIDELKAMGIGEKQAEMQAKDRADAEEKTFQKRLQRDKSFLGRMQNTLLKKTGIEKDPDAAEKAMEAKKAAAEQTGLLRSLAKGIGGGAMKGGMGLMGFFKKFIGGKLKLILMGLAGGLMVLFSQLKLSEVKKMWESFKNAIMAIWDFLSPIVASIWEWTKSVALPALVDTFIAQVGLVGELFSNLKERFSGFMEMSWSERITAIFGAFGDIASYVGDAVKNLLVMGEKMLGGDGTFVTDLWDKIGGFFTGLMDWFKLLWENPGKALSKAWTGLLDGAASIGGWLMDNAIKPAWEWLKGAWSGMTEAISAKWTEWFPDGIGTCLLYTSPSPRDRG